MPHLTRLRPDRRLILLLGALVACGFTYVTETPFVYIQYFHVSPQRYGRGHGRPSLAPST